MRTRYVTFFIIIMIQVGIGLTAIPASAQPLSALTDVFDGSLKHSTAVQFDDPDHFTSIYNCLNLEYDRWFGDHVQVDVTLKAVYDAVYDVEDDLNAQDEEDYRSYVDLREAVLGLSLEKFDLYLGRQQVVWGKTDGFRVTDVVNPLDLRDTASTEFLDQRIPLWMLNFQYFFTMEYSLQVLVIPDLQFNTLPDLALPPDAVVESTKEPDIRLDNTEVGFRLSGYANNWDFTLNYLYGWDDTPAFRKAVEPQSGTLTIRPRHERLHTVGGTVATILWDGVARGEVAARPGKWFSVDEPAVAGMVVEKTQLSYAVAFERDLWDIHWLAQTLQERILDYDSALTTDEAQTYLTLNASRKFLHEETLEIALSNLYNVNAETWTLQPSIEYAYSDPLALLFGVDVVVGADDKAGQERIYGEITYSF